MFKFSSLLRFCLVLLVCLLGSGQAGLADDTSALTYLNQLRAQVAMLPFSHHEQLQQAAANHAQYLTLNNLTGHDEQAGRSGFTGTGPGERAVAVGYPSRQVSENISYGDSDYRQSVDGLMSAIYHRHGFLAFDRDEIGFARSSYPDNRQAWVYNMGNSYVRALCSGDAFTGTGRYYIGICEPDIRLAAAVYEHALAQLPAANPELVVWPPINGTDIPPAFFEESPDPLPDFSVSGYPISVLFNPDAVTTAGVSRFTLYRLPDEHELENTRELNEFTDPNQRFNNLQYALFPLERLAWHTRYRVEIDYTQDGIPYTKQWTFTTRDLGIPVHTITTGDTLEVVAGGRFAVYIRPSDAYPTLSAGGGISWRYPRGMTIDSEFIDSNTVQLTVDGAVGDAAVFTYNDSSSFTIRLTEHANQAPSADAGADQAVTAGELVTLTGTGSDPEQDPLTYEWQQLGEQTVEIVPDGASIQFTAPGVATATPFNFELTVSDPHGASDSDQVTLTISPSVLPADIDGNGLVEEMDALMLLRHLFGFRGVALTQGLVDSANCRRCDAMAITAYLQEQQARYDIDNNGQVTALSDGLILLRYLRGYEGSDLIAQVIDQQDCRRCDTASVQTYIATELVR